MVMLGLSLYAAWAGFVGVPWWFALIGGGLFALTIVATAIDQVQREGQSFQHPKQLDMTLRLAPVLAVSLSAEWGAIFLIALFIGRGVAWLLM